MRCKSTGYHKRKARKAINSIGTSYSNLIILESRTEEKITVLRLQASE